MTSPAKSATPVSWGLRDGLASFPGRAAMAWRIALICALTSMVAMVYGIPEAALSGYLVFFVMKPDAAEGLLLAVALTVLVTMVIGLLLLLTRWTIDIPALRMVAIAVSSIFLLFLASASKLGPLGGIIALVLAFAMTLLSDVPFGEIATRGILYAGLMAVLPMGCVVLVNLTMGRKPLTLLRSTVRERLDAAANWLEHPSPANRSALQAAISEGLTESTKRWGLMRAFALGGRDETKRLDVAMRETYRLLLTSLSIDANTSEATRAALAGHARAAAQALGHGKPVATIPDAPQNNAAASPEVLDAWATLHRLSSTPTGEPYRASSTPFMREDAWTNPDHLRYAIKTTAAAILCYIIYTGIDWSGIHTAMITCYVAALGSVGETTRKLALRILGCAVGATMGIGSILFIIPHMSSVGGLMGLVFVGTFIAAWVAVGDERVSYAGVQIALAFLMTVLQGFGPSIDMGVARDRVVGIVLGNVVLYLMFTQFWPVSVAQSVRTRLSQCLATLAKMARLRDADRDARTTLAANVVEDLTGVRNELALLPFEPRNLRLKRSQVRHLMAIAQTIRDLNGRLLLAPEPTEGVAARLEDLARRTSTAASSEHVPDTHAARSRSRDNLNDDMNRLEEMIDDRR